MSATYVHRYIHILKASCVKTRVETMLSTVHAESWKNACDHVEKCERFYWERDGLLDELTEKNHYKCGGLRHRECRK